MSCDEAGDGVITHSDLKKDGSSTKSARFGELSAPSALKTTAILLSMIGLVVNFVL